MFCFYQIEIEFVVTDDFNQATVLRPVINVCACHNQGTCLPPGDENDEDNDVDNNGERFNILQCVCQNGYTGTFCEADLDACDENFQPCYPGVQCIDLKPPANDSGFECGSCPSGLTGNGVQCTGNRSTVYFMFCIWPLKNVFQYPTFLLIYAKI